MVEENLPRGHVSHSVRVEARPEPMGQVPHIIQSGAEVSLFGHGMHGASLSPENTKPSSQAKQRWENLGPMILPLFEVCVSSAVSFRALAAYSLGQVGWTVTMEPAVLQTSSPSPLTAWLSVKKQP